MACCLTNSDIISIVDIIVSAAIGIWIGTSVQKNLTKKRYLREYFIGELNSIRQEYKDLFSDIIFEKLNAITIKDRLKIMSARILSFDRYTRQIYDIKESLLKDEHAEFQQYITGHDEFNEQYQSEIVKFSSPTKTEILKRQCSFSDIITQCIIEINKAKYKRTCVFRHNR